MVLVLIRVRDCDNACCNESPRFPNSDGIGCKYSTKNPDKKSLGCKLMTGEETLPAGSISVAFPKEDGQIVFQQTCVDWPQKNSIKELGNTGSCCWQYVDA